MSRALKITVFALIAAVAALLASTAAEALLAKHNCTFCHSLHGAPTVGGSTSLVPDRSPTNLEVLCLGCHLTSVDGSNPTYGTDTDGVPADPVQPHKSDGGKAEFHATCSDCHEVHDNLPNWRSGDPAHTTEDANASVNGTTGINQKMIGTIDPDGTTPYAVIRTREKDFDRNGVPDRGTVTQTCDSTLVNDCYTTEKRYVIFEQAIPGSSLHAWADNDEDGKDPANLADGGPGPLDPTVLRSNESDSGALTSGANKNWSAFDSICQMCHTETANHNLFDGGGLSHNNSRACTDCHLHETCFDRAGCSAVAQTATRDLRVDLVSPAPDPVTPGGTVTITVDMTNLGTRNESFDVRYISDISGYLGMSHLVVNAGLSGQTSLNWVAATEGLHTITTVIDPVIYETVTDNNSLTATVFVGAVSNHDVAVTSVTAPSPILQGNTETVSVAIANPGTFTETFNVVLYDNTDDPGHASPIGTLSSGALAPSGTTTLNFSWNTTGASLGTHTLEAVADTVTGETNTANNSATTTSTVSLPTHDVAVDSVTAPASTPQGNTVAVDVVVSNPGTFTETFDVTLSSDLDGAIQTLSSGALVAGGSTTLNFSWNTTGATIATHTLTATAATVTGELNTADNSASTTADVAPAGPAPDVAAISVIPTPSSVKLKAANSTVNIPIVVENLGATPQTFDVNLYDTTDDPGHTSPIFTQTVTNLATGQTTLNFAWVVNNGTGLSLQIHTLTAVVSTVAGEVNTANNTVTGTVEFK